MNTSTGDKEFLKFAWFRIIAGLVIAVGILWGITFLVNHFTPQDRAASSGIHQTKGASEVDRPHIMTPDQKTAAGSAARASFDERRPETAADHLSDTAPVSDEPPGVAFVDALIAPIQFELTERFWGWRPNDIIKFTDNVNNFQIGVLEVTRRASIILTDKISRTGTTASLNIHLERAMNWFMIRAEDYWFPSAESRYREAIDELTIYKEQLRKHEAEFYTRTDNLIPLLNAFQELLGSCDNNLVKSREENGEPVSTFKADDYIFYAKGVASAIETILRAVEKDFPKILDTRNGSEILHHAIEACHTSAHINPWVFVTEADLSGIFANHRANMAAHISHARFYVGLLALTLST